MHCFFLSKIYFSCLTDKKTMYCDRSAYYRKAIKPLQDHKNKHQLAVAFLLFGCLVLLNNFNILDMFWSKLKFIGVQADTKDFFFIFINEINKP